MPGCVSGGTSGGQITTVARHSSAWWEGVTLIAQPLSALGAGRSPTQRCGAIEHAKKTMAARAQSITVVGPRAPDPRALSKSRDPFGKNAFWVFRHATAVTGPPYRSR